MGGKTELALRACHRGYSSRRSTLLVRENNDGTLPRRHTRGKVKPYPVEF